MWQKLVCAVFALLVTIGLVTAGEFQATITKVDGNKITYQKYLKAKKGEKAEKDGDAVTIEAAKDVKVLKGMYNKDDKKWEAGDAIEGGLKAEVFTKISEKGVRASITTDDDKKVVTQIMTVGGKKGK